MVNLEDFSTTNWLFLFFAAIVVFLIGINVFFAVRRFIYKRRGSQMGIFSPKKAGSQTQKEDSVRTYAPQKDDDRVKNQGPTVRNVIANVIDKEIEERIKPYIDKRIDERFKEMSNDSINRSEDSRYPTDSPQDNRVSSEDNGVENRKYNVENQTVGRSHVGTSSEAFSSYENNSENMNDESTSGEQQKHDIIDEDLSW